MSIFRCWPPLLLRAFMPSLATSCQYFMPWGSWLQDDGGIIEEMSYSIYLSACLHRQIAVGDALERFSYKNTCQIIVTSHSLYSAIMWWNSSFPAAGRRIENREFTLANTGYSQSPFRPGMQFLSGIIDFFDVAYWFIARKAAPGLSLDIGFAKSDR